MWNRHTVTANCLFTKQYLVDNKICQLQNWAHFNWVELNWVYVIWDWQRFTYSIAQFSTLPLSMNWTFWFPQIPKQKFRRNWVANVCRATFRFIESKLTLRWLMMKWTWKKSVFPLSLWSIAAENQIFRSDTNLRWVVHKCHAKRYLHPLANSMR